MDSPLTAISINGFSTYKCHKNLTSFNSRWMVSTSRSHDEVSELAGSSDPLFSFKAGVALFLV
jgi:hypothetical protein